MAKRKERAERVRVYIRGIFARLGVAGRTHAVYTAVGKGILAAPDFKE